MFVRGPWDDAVGRRHILSGDHAVHAQQRLGSGSIDRDDARMRMWTSQDLAVKHPWQSDVIRVDSTPSGLIQPFDLPHGRSY